MTKSGWAGLFLVGAIALAGCKDNDTEYVTTEATTPTDLVGANIVAFHSGAAATDNGSCVTCHGSMLDRETLDPTYPEFHYYKLNATDGIMPEYKCVDCHTATDLISGSGATINKQVSVDLCRTCHKPNGSAKELYAQ